MIIISNWSIKTFVFIINTIGTIDDLIENKLEFISKIKEYRRIAFLNWKRLSTNEINLSDVVDFENGAQPPKEQHIYESKEGYIRFVQNRDYDSDFHLTYIPKIISTYQAKEKYDIDLRMIAAGANPKKVKPEYWMKMNKN